MVTYCLGSAGAKRRDFRSKKGGGVVTLDNDDVLADFLLDGKQCFVIGELPFGDFCVSDYICYHRALKTKLPLRTKAIRNLLHRCGSKAGAYRRIARLDRLEYRKLQLAAKLEDDTHTVYVNFDGLPYSRKNKAKMDALLRSWQKFTVFAAVSDSRFVQKGCSQVEYFSDGAVRGKSPATAQRVSPRKLNRKLKEEGLYFKWDSVKCGVIVR